MSKTVTLNPEVLKTIAASALVDGRVVGLMSGRIVAAAFGGVAEGGGNRVVKWREPQSGIVYTMGTGEYPACFVSSSSKGVGRGGKELKDGDNFCHLYVCPATQRITIKFFTKNEVLASL